MKGRIQKPILIQRYLFMPNKILSILRLIAIIVIAIGCASCTGYSSNDGGCLDVGETAYASEDLECCDGTELLKDYMVRDDECVGLGEYRTCLDCGNGICGDSENKCNCPDDCDPNGCIAQGETRYPNDGNRCCAYLETAWNYLWDDIGECTAVTMEGSHMQQLICVNCGNGVCEEGENPCICPSDCGDLACADHGVVPWPTAEGDFTYARCCDGLENRHQKDCYNENCTDLCEEGGVGGYYGICLSCGDGICDEPVESKCNCPEDCM